MKYIQFMLLFLPILFFSCNKESQELHEEVSITGSIVECLNGSSDIILMEGVTVNLLQEGVVIQSTEDASFRFENLEVGRNYTIVPEKQDNASNGVSTFDIALIQAYLNGNTDLDIEQLIASDMDRNLIVNQTDIDILTECVKSNAMDDCLDWRFYHEDCESLDQEELINEIQFNKLNSDKLDMKIYARNTGNLN